MKDATKTATPMTKEKIKAFKPHIVVDAKGAEPYYSIVYYDIADRHWHEGFGSYNLSFVREWLEEEFEEVEVDLEENAMCKDLVHDIGDGGDCDKD